MNSHFFSIKNIYILGNKNVSGQEIIKIVKEKLKNRYLTVYDKNNILFYPEDDIEKFILEKNKKIKSLDISYKNFKGDIEINIIEKKGEFLYCHQKENIEKCFFVEKNGRIFTEFKQKETEINKNDFLVFIETLNYKRIPDSFLEEMEFQKLINLILSLEEINLKTVKVKKNNFNQFVFYFKNESKIIFSFKQDLLKIPLSLKKISSIENLKIDNNKKSFSNLVDYINLSFEDTIFYCFKQEKCQGNY